MIKISVVKRMRFIEKVNREFSDIVLPSIFISNNMPSLDEASIKTYIYILFLSRNSIDFSLEDMAKNLGLKKLEIEKALDILESEELILKNIDGYEVLDIKEQEINSTYMPKLKPKQSEVKSITEKRRIAAASAINDSFFQGIMALSWYVDINTLFEKYAFDEDVMIALFHECGERKALKKNYVFKVAESWYKGGVKTFEQLEDYQKKSEDMSKLKSKIKSKLRFNRAFTEYEEQYITEWIEKYKYSFEEIDYAIKKTLTKGTPSIGYINGILRNWNEKGFKKLTDIIEAESLITKDRITEDKIKKSDDSKNKAFKHRNYEQRKNVNLNEYYDNL